MSAVIDKENHDKEETVMLFMNLPAKSAVIKRTHRVIFPAPFFPLARLQLVEVPLLEAAFTSKQGMVHTDSKKEAKRRRPREKTPAQRQKAMALGR